MQSKKYLEKRCILSILVVLFLFISNIFASGSILKNEVMKSKIDKNSSYFLDENKNEWFDGNFIGSWGKNKDYSEGNIWGQINQKRRSTLGLFFGEYSNINDNT